MKKPVAIVMQAGSEPPTAWCRQVGRHCKFVWVRLEGMFSAEEQQRKDWSHSVRRWTPDSNTLAGVVTLNLSGVHRQGSQRYKRWPRWLALAPRVRASLIAIAKLQPYQVGVFCEDFSARVLMEADYKPTALVLDNPLVSRAELAQHRVLAARGYVRTSYFTHRDLIPGWGLPFDAADLVDMRDERCRWGVHGHWDVVPNVMRQLVREGHLVPSYAQGGIG